MPERPSQRALSDFVSEAQEIIEALDRDLLRLEDTRRGVEADPDVLNAVFRAAHSLKGLAAMVGVERLTLLAHALEDRLDGVRMGRQPLDAATLDLLLGAPGLFARIVAEEAEQKPPGTAAAAEQLAARLRATAPAAAAPDVDPVAALRLDPRVRAVLTAYEEHRLRSAVVKGLRIHRVRAGFDLATFDTALDALKQRLKEHGEVVATLPSPDGGDPDRIAFEVLFATAAGVEVARAAAGDGAEVEEIRRAGGPGGAGPAAAPELAAPAPEPEAPVPGEAPVPASELPAFPPTEAGASLRSMSQAVRVDIRKLDRLMNLVGELLLVKSSLLRVAGRLRAGDHSTTLGLELQRESRTLERKLAELQGGILEVRMVPLGQIFEKLARMVRKLSRELQKEVELEVRGSEVELDKLLVEELSDPLMHLLRNALDHAIEPPEDRVRVGKPAAGRIGLSARQQGSHVLITVEDDGAGIDEWRVREVAVQRGLASSDAVAQLSPREVMNLIFAPGFSTAHEVTALSGRGVGLDVVKSNIARMSGILELHTELGRGTRFEITLPVTLAIIRALVVASAGRTYALPLNGVLEVVTVERRDLRTIEGREVTSLRGTTLPLVRLDDFLGTPGERPPGPLHVVVVALAHERMGLVVDGLIGQQDVVVKPLGSALASVRGIAGATDLGNRRTVLVLDVAAIVQEVALGEERADPPR